MRAAPYPGIAICFQPRQERPSVFISELKDVFSTMHSPRLYDLHVTATSRASESREHSPPICSHPAAAFPLQRQAGMPRCVSAQRHQRWPDPDISSESRRRWRLLPLYRTCFPSHSANRHHCNMIPLFLKSAVSTRIQPKVLYKRLFDLRCCAILSPLRVRRCAMQQNGRTYIKTP